MADILRVFPRYFSILKGEVKPKFKLNKASLEEKIERASAILKNCNLCERVCGVNRKEGETGYCRIGNKISVGAHGVGSNDLNFIVPSYDIFFSGCTLKCVFCQNSDLSQNLDPRLSLSEQHLAKVIDSRSTCKSVDFVGGDPLPQLPFVLKILNYLNRDIPVMWNSSFYMTLEAMDLLTGIIDIYSPDFKYGNDSCAKRLSDVKNYTGVVSRNIQIAAKDSEVIIRHLVMPNHLECCSKPVLDCISEKYGDKVLVHLMDQYTPDWRAKQYPDINRTLRKKEFTEIVHYAEKKRLNFILGC